jgi:glycosidase
MNRTNSLLKAKILRARQVLLLVSAFSLQPSAFLSAAPWTTQNSAWNVNTNSSSVASNYAGNWSGHSYFPSPDDWRKIPVYQFITDRWNDGDPSNNELLYGGYDLRDVGARHGGDFLGIRDKLDYIRALGYKAIWVSPVFQNRNNSYHGYGQIDFTLLDERFGTLEDFRAMVTKAHELGMYVIVDIVVNHLENLYYFDGHQNDGAPFHLHSGEYNLYPRNAGETYTDFPVNNTWYSSGQYCNVFGDDGYVRTDSGGGSFWDSDLHHNGDLNDYGDPWQNHLGKIYGALDDVRTTHPRVQDKIIAMTKALISSTDIDGIRMDTPMQVPRYFFQRWCPAVKSHAASLGKNDFFIFGEFYCSRERAATMVGRGKSPNMYGNGFAFIDGDYTMDGGINYRAYFDFFQPAVKNQVNGNLGNLKSGFDTDLTAFDFYDPVWSEVRYTHLNFYNNHDQWRMVHNPSGATEGFQKTDLASAIIGLWPGMPLFYYGDEQGFCSYGTALDGWSREDFMTSLAWDNVSALVSPNPAQKDNFDMTNPHYLWVQKCMNVRDKYPALQNTDTVYERWKQTSSQNGIYAYSRSWGNLSNWVMVAFNTWSASLSAGGGAGDFFTGWGEGDVIVNALNTNETYTLTTSGKLSSLTVGGYETKVFVRQDNLKPLSPVVTNCVPAHDVRVTNSSVTVQLKFSEAMDENSVKSAFRFDGQSVSSGALTWNVSTRELSFGTNVTDGVHTIEVLTNATSSAGLTLFGAKFRSRFLYGGDTNIIVNRSATNDVTLIEQGASTTSTTNVTLYHKAAGAQKMRVRVNSGPWSGWSNYTATSACTLPTGNGTKSVEVQYWVDGSAAYFVSDTIQLGAAGSDVAVENFTGYSSSLYNQSGGTGWSGNWYDQGYSSSPNVIQSALSTVNTVASFTPFVEYPLNNTMGGINILEATRNLSSTVSSGTVYVYGLMAIGNFSTANSYGGIGLFNGTTEKFLIGQRWQAANWGATASGNLNGVGADSSTNIGNYVTALLCAKIDFSARTLTLWVNPNFNKTEACSATSASFNFGNNDASFNVVRLRAGNANNGNKWQFDNINLTTGSPFAASGPTATVSGSATICSGSATSISADLTGTGPWTVTWSDSVITNVSSSPATRSVSPSLTTNYTVTALTDSTGCSAGALSGNAVITVKAPATVNAGSDQTVTASTSTISLSGTMGGGATTAIWSGGSGTFEDFNNGTGHYYPTETERLVTRSVTLTLTSGGQLPCAAVIDSMTITFNPMIYGQLQLQGFTGTEPRAVQFVASDSGGVPLQTNEVSLTFAGNPMLANYTLTVPTNTAYLSAKTAWHLRKRLAVTFVNNVATNNFSGSHWLLGGDLVTAVGSTNIDDTDNLVNAVDLGLLLGYYLNPVGSDAMIRRADIDGDAAMDMVNAVDLSILLGNYLLSGDPR